ncbi:hypothetical protein F5I97DRAFT_1877802 [Phlebopus sp. FC_14]|nr:hypothetical protein F5I97DRAFT_1877802 [Phlebopus sp. FC_14]
MEVISPASAGTEAILRRILATGQHLVDITKSSAYHPLHENPDYTPTLHLPEPPDITPALITAGAHHPLAVEMNQAYRKRACELKVFHEAAFTRIARHCSRLVSPCTEHPDRNLTEAFTRTYLKHLQALQTEGVTMLMARLSSAISLKAGNETDRRRQRSFNHDYVPLLEHFFEENPFPSHADKVFLAKKSGMSYRQIHVWFQNRRNRIKKEGKVLRRKPMGEGALLPLDRLYQSMARYTVPGAQLQRAREKSTKVELNLTQPVTPQSGQLDTIAPPHAFPTPYPPSCSYDPFPLVPPLGMSSSSALPWFRKQSTVQSRPSVIDISELVELFSQLHVREDSNRHNRLPKLDASAATVSITYRPFPAPLPAFTPQKVTCTLASPTNILLPTVAAPPHRLHVFRSPSPKCKPATLLPSTQSRSRAKVCKTAPLPRRIPHHSGVTQSETIVSEPEAPVSHPSSTISSRTSSCSPDGRRSDNNDRNSMSPSTDDLSTPESSPPQTQLQCHSPSVNPMEFSWDCRDFICCPSLQRNGLQLQFGLPSR